MISSYGEETKMAKRGCSRCQGTGWISKNHKKVRCPGNVNVSPTPTASNAFDNEKNVLVSSQVSHIATARERFAVTEIEKPQKVESSLTNLSTEEAIVLWRMVETADLVKQKDILDNLSSQLNVDQRDEFFNIVFNVNGYKSVVEKNAIVSHRIRCLVNNDSTPMTLIEKILKWKERPSSSISTLHVSLFDLSWRPDLSANVKKFISLYPGFTVL